MTDEEFKELTKALGIKDKDDCKTIDKNISPDELKKRFGKIILSMAQEGR